MADSHPYSEIDKIITSRGMDYLMDIDNGPQLQIIWCGDHEITIDDLAVLLRSKIGKKAA